MSEWINVKNACPISMTEVLVNIKILFNSCKVAVHIENMFYENGLIDFDITRYVTHWMPLPDEPK